MTLCETLPHFIPFSPNNSIAFHRPLGPPLYPLYGTQDWQNMISGIFGDSADTPEPPPILGGASHPSQALPHPTEPSPFAPPPAMPSLPSSSPVVKPSSPAKTSPAADNKLDPDIGILITGCQEGETSADIRPSKGKLCKSSVWYTGMIQQSSAVMSIQVKCHIRNMAAINSIMHKFLELLCIDKIGHVNCCCFSLYNNFQVSPTGHLPTHLLLSFVTMQQR